MALMESIEMDKLGYEIFSILENKFLFGGGGSGGGSSCYGDSLPQTPTKTPTSDAGGKVRVLSIDGGVGASGALLAAAALSRLESSLRSRSGNPDARIPDYFDVAAGSGAGGVLAAMLFTRGPDGGPLFTADEALRFLSQNRQAIASPSNKGLLRGIFRRTSGGIFRRMFGESTLRDTLKPVLIPCFDLRTGATFVFSRADAVESDGYDFKICDVCAATCADRREVEMASVDGKTAILAVGGGAAMANPTSAAITHVLNNKTEFPFANGVDDLLVVSLGNGETDSVNGVSGSATPSRAALLKIAVNGAADTVDEAVGMAFGHNRTTNYLRIQANGLTAGRSSEPASEAEEMLSHRNVESVMFRGRKVSELSNGERLERFADELIKEHQRRKSSPIPTVLIKNAMTPRSSSATISTTFTSSSTSTTSP